MLFLNAILFRFIPKSYPIEERMRLLMKLRKYVVTHDTNILKPFIRDSHYEGDRKDKPITTDRTNEMVTVDSRNILQRINEYGKNTRMGGLCDRLAKGKFVKMLDSIEAVDQESYTQLMYECAGNPGNKA